MGFACCLSSRVLLLCFFAGFCSEDREVLLSAARLQVGIVLLNVLGCQLTY